MAYRVIIGLPRWYFTGPEVFAARLVRGLQEQGHDAHILLTELGFNRIQEGPWSGIPVPSDLPCQRLPAGDNDTWGQRWEALERYLEERAPCFYIMLHDWRNNVIASRLSRRVHLIGLVQADSELELDQAERLGQYWQAIVAVSDILNSKLLARLPHLAPKILTIRNAVPTLQQPPLKAKDGPLRLVYSGELRAHQKRLDDMAAVALRLADRGVPFQLTFYGEGSYRADLEDKLSELISRKIVLLPGRINGEELLNALESQHVFLLTSEFEGLSIAMLEAMSRACVPVVSQLASQSSILQSGINSLTAKVGDIEGFVSHIELLSRDRARLLSLSNAAFASIQDGGYRVEDMLSSYLALFKRIESESLHRDKLRPRLPMLLPPQEVGGIGILPGIYDHEINAVNRQIFWPDPPLCAKSQASPLNISPEAPLKNYKILVTASLELISGVDVFAMHLVRGLCQRGFDARILIPQELADSTSLLDLSDLPLEINTPLDCIGWSGHWQRLIEKLSQSGPAIYVPNYDYSYSCVAPQLPGHVRVIGIAHNDDPSNYEHLCRIGDACDAIVGVSTAITGHLSRLAAHFSSKLVTIPYGVSAPAALPVRQAPSQQGGRANALRIVFVGRLVRSQKRAEDLIAIAKELELRHISHEIVVIGDGELRSTLERALGELIMKRKIWFTGAQSHAITLKFLESCDVFLLPSSFEGLPIAMLEAMACAVVPVVSAVRSGVADVIIDGENGLVAPVADIKAFADRIEWLFNNPVDLRRMAAAAASTIRQGYLVDQMIDRYVDLFRQVAARPSGRIPGPIVPPRPIADELKWSAWARRVVADPMASLQRVRRRFDKR